MYHTGNDSSQCMHFSLKDTKCLTVFKGVTNWSFYMKVQHLDNWDNFEIRYKCIPSSTKYGPYPQSTTSFGSKMFTGLKYIVLLDIKVQGL